MFARFLVFHCFFRTQAQSPKEAYLVTVWKELLVRIVVSLLAILLAAPQIAGAASSPTTRISGTIVSMGAGTLTVDSSSGRQTVKVDKGTRLFGVDHSSLDKVTAGAFIGTTVAPQPNGTYTSIEVHIFAPALRGTGEGFTKMNDSDHHMMANATVRTVAQPHMMANSTVKTAGTTASGKTITMTFPSGKKVINIPSSVPVVYIERATPAMLVRGAHVQVVAEERSGTLTAHYVIVGEHGMVPPM